MPEPRLTSGLRGRLEQHVFLVVVLAVCVAIHLYIARDEVVQDAWYSLLGGRTVVHSGLPHHDTWTLFSLGKTWVDEQWLGHVILYSLWALAGWRLALLGVVAMFLGAFAVLAFTARRLGASDRAVAAVAIATYLTGIDNSALRAQIPAYLLFAAVLALLVADARSPSSRVYLVFPVLVLWANVHGSVVLGAGLVILRGLTVAGAGLRRRLRRGAQADSPGWAGKAAALIVLSPLCALVTPYGLGIFHYYRTTLGNSALKNSATEWGPTTLRDQPLFVLLLLVAVWLLARSRAGTTAFERLALLLTGILGLYAIRYGIWFTLAATISLPATLDALWRPTVAERRERLNLAIVTAALAVVVLSVATTASRSNRYFEHSFPRKAANVVAAAEQAHPGLKIFSNERFADWLMFEHPSLEGHVAYDVRFELLTAAQLTSLIDYRVEVGLSWERAARGYGLLVLDPGDDKKTIKVLKHRANVKVLFHDKHVVVLQRPA